MKNSNEESLKVIKETIFDKIRKVINRLFNKNNETETKVEVTQNNEKQEFINNLKYNTEDEKELVKRIEEEEIKLEEKKDEELEQINANLSRYLEKIQKEIEKSKTEKNIVENQINKYKEQMEEYQEKLAN